MHAVATTEPEPVAGFASGSRASPLRIRPTAGAGPDTFMRRSSDTAAHPARPEGGIVSRASDTPAPVFLLSLPRSGSTLLQRILAAHPEVASATEPGILIPPLLVQREQGVYGTYDHATTGRFLRAFLEETAAGPESYRRAVRDFA